MKNAKKNVIKALVLIALFCPTAFAEGEMGGGGFAACEDPAHPGTFIECTKEGEMGGGGRMSNSGYLDSAYIFLDAMIREIL